MNPEFLTELEALALKYKVNLYGNVVAFVGDTPTEFAVGEADLVENKPVVEESTDKVADDVVSDTATVADAVNVEVAPTGEVVAENVEREVNQQV